MKQERLRHKKRLFKQKKNGSSVYIYIPIVFLLVWVLIYVSVYIRAADTLYENYKTSIDNANLSVTIANSDVLLHDGRLGIVALSDDGSVTEMNAKEKAKVGKLFESYEKVLQSNVGLDESFTFKGGTCGWAGDMLASGTAVIDTFVIYDIALDDTVYSYEISAVESYKTASEIQTKIKKRVAGSVTRDSNGDVNSTTAKTPENTLVTDCTVYSKVSFPVKASSIANLSDGNMEGIDADSKDYLEGKMRVSTSSTTSLKTSDAFKDLNGNGWFQ